MAFSPLLSCEEILGIEALELTSQVHSHFMSK